MAVDSAHIGVGKWFRNRLRAGKGRRGIGNEEGRPAFFFAIIQPMLKIDVISVQPKMFEGFLTESIVARAVAKDARRICRVV